MIGDQVEQVSSRRAKVRVKKLDRVGLIESKEEEEEMASIYEI